ncbi:MAG: DUF5692 family protein [Myxococcota bacterium]
MDLLSVSTLTLQLALLGLVLWAVIELTRGSRSMSVALFIVLPVAILPLILQTEWNGWFNLAKSMTMIFVGVYLTAMRLGLRSRAFTVLFSLLFLLNIVEATAQDFSSGHWLNFAAGLLVIGLLPAPQTLRVDDRHSLSYPTSWWFIAAYTVWNFCFLFSYESVRGYQGDYTYIAALLLAVPIFAALRLGAHRYTQARAYSLAFCITMTEASVVALPEAWPLAEASLFSPLAHQALSAVSLVVGVVAWWQIRRSPQQFGTTLWGSLVQLPKPTRPALAA